MKIQIVGMPLTTHNRLKALGQAWVQQKNNEHSIIFSPSFDTHRPTISERELANIAHHVGRGYVYLIVVPSADWHYIRDKFKYNCRVSLIRESWPYSTLSWDTVENCISKIIEIEARWDTIVKPCDVSHPLLLPEAHFLPKSKLANFWGKCDVYGDQAKIEAAARVVSDTYQSHYRRQQSGNARCWVDEQHFEYSHDRGRHAITLEERASHTPRFRFCFEVPVGFHFDVSKSNGHMFTIRCSDKNVRCKHANIDPWGYVRAIENA